MATNAGLVSGEVHLEGLPLPVMARSAVKLLVLGHDVRKRLECLVVAAGRNGLGGLS